MPRPTDDSFPTRSSLLRRVKNLEDHASWQEFVDTYKRMVRGLALNSGLNAEDAKDVVQETFSEVAKEMPEFQYDATGSFKGWLLQRAQWRIVDYLRRKAHTPFSHASGGSALEAIPDPASLDFIGLWDREWAHNLLRAAMALVRQKVKPEKYQIFDLYVNKDRAPEELAAKFNVSVRQVYLIKHRVSRMIQAAATRLEKQMSRPVKAARSR